MLYAFWWLVIVAGASGAPVAIPMDSERICQESAASVIKAIERRYNASVVCVRGK